MEAGHRQERGGTKMAVVLAAGCGSRLWSQRRLPPKPLVRVLGVSLLERQLRGLSRLPGLEEVIVVIGHEAEVVRQWLERSGPWPFVLRTVENPEWEKGNGTSLDAVKDLVDGQGFFVLMVDHLYEPSTLEIFVNEVRGDLALAVSVEQDHILDLDDATKVQIDESKTVRAIGKNLSDFNAVEIGLFRLDGRIFDCLKQAFHAGKYNLVTGVQHLIAETPLRAVPSPCPVFDIDTWQDLRHAERHLMRQIPSGRDGLVARHLNRRLSLPVSRWLVNFGVKPIQVTLFAFAMSVVSGLLFALGLPVAGGLMAQASSVVDGMDGEIARLRGATSRFGGFIDSLLDRLGEGAILVGLGLFALSGAPGSTTFVLAALALLVSPLSMAVKDRYSVVYKRPYLSDDLDGWARFLLANHDGRMFLVCLGGIFSLPRLTLALLVGLGLIQAVYRIWRVRRTEPSH